MTATGESVGARTGLGMPMGAAAGRKADASRERSGYLTEDEDVWTENGKLAPRVIGEPTGNGH
ncbi:hypothetical protein [Actinomadura litoris]|uniref:hypothetical protein n=1 Tax=Actinomadura litoris TaxID=2678616 RepID=UPI001FA7F3E9|nr:hypothetical protein [Actinomadura litoris]